MKVCRKCKEEKPLTEFHVDKSHSDGRANYCKACYKSVRAAWRIANLEKVKSMKAAWYVANKDKVKAKCAARYAANPEKDKARSAAWRVANPEKAKACSKSWRIANPEKAKANDKLTNKSNMERISDCYIARVVKLPVATLPQELINMKREQLKMYRATKQLIQTIKETKDAS